METFPCIICGAALERVVEHAEGQPSDGIMCETAGNYGSTVWDSMGGEVLAFNICDPCMVRAGEQGRVMTCRRYRLILADEATVGPVVVGREHLDRAYVPWHQGLGHDDEPVHLSADELAAIEGAGIAPQYPARIELQFPVEKIRQMAGPVL
jgi:hypothetical protein